MLKPCKFTKSEMLHLLEVASIALQHPDFFVHVADQMDMTDDDMTALKTKVTTFVNDEESYLEMPSNLLWK